MRQPIPLLTIAGSDSGGAAGLQADLKTWTSLGFYGMSAITAVTAQNSERVRAVQFLPPDFVAAQIDSVLEDYGAAAIKTGFIGQVELVEAIAGRLAEWREKFKPRPHIIIDPVLVNNRHEPMFPPIVAEAYRKFLFPLADLLTPNLAEAELLGLVIDRQWLLPTDLIHSGVSRILLKGLWEKEGEIIDLFWDGQTTTFLPQQVIPTENVHGSGDTLSAAICAFLAKGYEWLEAVRRAQEFTHAAIFRSAGWRLGAGHGPLGYRYSDD